MMPQAITQNALQSHPPYCKTNDTTNDKDGSTK